MTGRVLVRATLCETLDATAASCAGIAESGGILLGSYRGGDVEVTARTLPGPSDEQRPFSFVKVDPLHQAAASTAWAATGGTQTCVGEWHTHPSGGLHPSGTDLGTWARLVREGRRPMVFILAVPGLWGVFLARPSWWRKSIACLPRLEVGSLGMVFGPPSSVVSIL